MSKVARNRSSKYALRTKRCITATRFRCATRSPLPKKISFHGNVAKQRASMEFLVFPQIVG